MAEKNNEPVPQPNQALPAYMFKDPVLTFFTLPVLPFILFFQSINNMISSMPKSNVLNTQAASYYKNDETWIISEDKNGDIKIKVQRLAQR